MPHVLGVADGVGSWAARGVDPGEYSRALMKSCWDAATDASVNGESLGPKEILSRAYCDLCESKIVGSSTAVLASVEGSTLEILNIGDSGCLVYQGDQLLFRTQEQQHAFNFPFQLGTGSEDTPDSGALSTFAVAAGQVVVVATDGVLDNLFEDDIGRILACVHGVPLKKLDTVLAQAAKEIVEKASYAAVDRGASTPFQERCLERGMMINGGKLDDATVVLGYLSDFCIYEDGDRTSDNQIENPLPFLSFMQ